ncbi:uncharacterized protein LOC108739128 isoform X2 [Agrilus planipennis]|uniref:Uncharacterized protein LOC108739128 isoform X2 n=1 Tax=Agrilus planipennis TaxID=224129 RepID=A0A1W4WWY9_AGRPL|nr:uncharacterized protein LOC108739128 isoform X2 [Agrilus planipennis]
MIVLLLCCMMKLIEFSTGKPDGKKQRRKLYRKRRGKAMNDLGVGGGGKILAHSPGSDCNSNHHLSSNSCFSSTSTQDIDFIQDNSDYQWFLDYNYRDGSTNHHTSILSLSEAYGGNGVVQGGDIRYYDALAKNMDANLAEADMESFRTEDIHALLTNLPTMCTDPLSQETISRHGESFASVSGSMLAKFDFESSLSPHSNSQCDGGDSANSMSICKSELLFSPIKESPPFTAGVGIGGFGGNYSVDSLDCGDFMSEQDILLTCQANKDNYTIAFEGSITMYSEDSDFHESEKSNSASGVSSSRCSGELKMHVKNPKVTNISMAQSDSGGFTTWSNLKKRNSENQLKRRPSGNNNSEEDTNNDYNHTDNVLKSQSMPDLCKQKRYATNDAKNQNFIITHQMDSIISSEKKPVKVFDIQHQIRSCSGSGGSILSDMATSTDGTVSSTEQASKHQKPNLNLVKLFMKQKSVSAEGMSLGMDQSRTTNNSETHSANSSQFLDSKQESQTEPDRNECFEDSLLVCQKPIETSHRTHELIVEEDEEVSRSESIEQLTESFSKLDLTDNSYRDPSPIVTTSNNNNNPSVATKNVTSSPIKKIAETRIRRTSTEVPAHLINRSIQTSCYVDTNLKNAPYKLNCNSAKEFVKVVEPSFLTKLKKDSEVKKPVYVLYPNYVLPDLNFLHGKEDIAKVLLMPHKNPKELRHIDRKRPVSFNDVEALREKGFSHVKDWDSLNFLLPTEYRKILADVPEVATKLKNKDDILLGSLKPSFCQSPPVSRKSRPASCDCAKLMNRTNSLERVSSSSSVTTQPSSGYRGSSTILTDSQSSPANPNNLNPLFVYRYDSVTSSEASLMVSERNRSITTIAPPYPKRSLSLENKAEIVPPRPPLPKSILRRSLETVKSRKLGDQNKRFSMFEAMEEEIDYEQNQNKRYSMQEQFTFNRNKRISETEDEGVDAGTSSSSLDEPQCKLVSSPRFKTELPLHKVNYEELAQLEEYLKMSGFSSSDPDDLDEEGMMQLRSYVAKFLALKINQSSSENSEGKKIVSFAERINVNVETKPPNNSPNVSALLSQKHHHYHGKTNADDSVGKKSYDLSQKRSLVAAVTDAVEKMVTHFSPASNQEELNALGDSSVNPACAKLALSTLCPALYAILSDGLKPSLDTTFGPINNSVWQVVEVSSHQGPLTKALNELVMRINTEDTITEGLVKFNAFIFGLLNVRSLDAWFSYLRTRESVLKKHYEQDSLLVLAHTGSVSVRGLMDTLITTLEPLALLPFRFDLLFEHRQLHESLKRMDSYQQPLSPSHPKSPGFKTSKQWTFSKLSSHSNSDTDEVSAATVQYFSPKHAPQSPINARPKTYPERPRSCTDSNFSKPTFKLGDDVTKKRWSGISPTSKLFQAYDRLAKEDDEDYTDSLETCPQKKKSEREGNQEDECSSNEEVVQLPEEGPDSLDSNLSDSKPINGRRFKKLQMKWEMLSGKESTSSGGSPPQSPTHGNKSKIPRPVTSPNRPSGIPVAVNNINKTTGKKAVTPPGTSTTKAIGQTRTPGGSNVAKSNAGLKKNSPATRTSRLDRLENYEESPRPMTRPSSLPYKPGNNRSNKSLPPRRAVSSSVGRKTTSPKVQIPKKLSTSKYKKVRKTWNGFQNVHVEKRYVKALSHRLPSESGHLSYNTGDQLKVILEVDQKWLLCCKGSQKGLVPKTDVIADNERF